MVENTFSFGSRVVVEYTSTSVVGPSTSAVVLEPSAADVAEPPTESVVDDVNVDAVSELTIEDVLDPNVDDVSGSGVAVDVDAVNGVLDVLDVEDAVVLVTVPFRSAITTKSDMFKSSADALRTSDNTKLKICSILLSVSDKASCAATLPNHNVKAMSTFSVSDWAILKRRSSPFDVPWNSRRQGGL